MKKRVRLFLEDETMASKNVILWRTVIQAIESYFLSFSFDFAIYRFPTGLITEAFKHLLQCLFASTFAFKAISSTPRTLILRFFLLLNIFFLRFSFSFSCHLTKEERSQEGQWERRIRKPENHNNYKSNKDSEDQSIACALRINDSYNKNRCPAGTKPRLKYHNLSETSLNHAISPKVSDNLFPPASSISKVSSPATFIWFKSVCKIQTILSKSR